VEELLATRLAIVTAVLILQMSVLEIQYRAIASNKESAAAPMTGRAAVVTKEIFL
jgi:hypothetical protein